MGTENVIITGNQSANYNQYSNFGGGGGFSKSQSIKYGRVTAINPDRTIQYELITNTLKTTKLNNNNVPTGKAYNFNPNFTRLPQVGEIVPLIEGPSNQIGNPSQQFDKLTYYLISPISVQNTVDDNKVPQTLPPPPPNVVKNYKANDIGVSNKTNPTSTNQPPTKKPTLKWDYIITRPISSSTTFAILYGGMPHSVNGAKKMQEIVNSLGLSSWRNWIFTDYDNSLDALIIETKTKYKLNDISISSICGWSRGGQDVWGMIGKFGVGKPFIGLMDPTTISTSYNTNDPNIRMMYRTENWPPSQYPTINKNLPIMAEKLGYKAEYIKSNSNNHYSIPKLFLQKYKSYL